jgi:hypothetical protein
MDGDVRIFRRDGLCLSMSVGCVVAQPRLCDHAVAGLIPESARRVRTGLRADRHRW